MVQGRSKRSWVAATLLLGGCGAASTPSPRSAASAPPPRAIAARGLVPADAVLGQTAGALEAAFGAPASRLVEGTATRLQFAGAACVLDAYLYPSERGEPAVTHVDTRRVTGEDIDRAACVAALRKR